MNEFPLEQQDGVRGMKQADQLRATVMYIRELKEKIHCLEMLPSGVASKAGGSGSGGLQPLGAWKPLSADDRRRYEKEILGYQRALKTARTITASKERLIEQLEKSIDSYRMNRSVAETARLEVEGKMMQGPRDV